MISFSASFEGRGGAFVRLHAFLSFSSSLPFKDSLGGMKQNHSLLWSGHFLSVLACVRFQVSYTLFPLY